MNMQLEAEQAIIGASLIDQGALSTCVAEIKPEDFSVAEYREIWTTILDLANKRLPVDVLTVSERLGSHWLGNLGLMASRVPSVSNVGGYVKLLRKRKRLTKLKDAAIEIADIASRAQCDKDAIEQAQGIISSVSHGVMEKELTHAKEIMVHVLNDITERYEGKKKSLTTGYKSLDEKIGGWEPGDLVIIAGRPGMGKTTLAMNIAERVGRDAHVAIFSLEMTREQLIQRMTASMGRIDSGKFRSGQFDDADWPKLTSATTQISMLNMHVDDEGGMSVSRLVAKARRANMRHKLTYIIVDYLQLLNAGQKTDNRTAEVAIISGALKSLAKELGAVVIALSQLSRSVESRQDKRPLMSDLRESGAIEQDADNIIFTYRDEYYDENTPNKGIVEAIISKNRHGETGMAPLAFIGRFTRIEDLAESGYRYREIEPEDFSQGFR